MRFPPFAAPLRPLLIMGTRPEAIKMAPVVKQCQQHPAIEPIVCFTGQHREMLAQVAEYFEIEADENLDLMRPNQTLTGLTAGCLEGLDRVIGRYHPDCLVAQGDTTTVMAAAMVAFYHKLPFVHVEAGLRTGNLYSPWPEEYNRRVAGITAALHCAPTQRAASCLLNEGVPESAVHVTGNTVIDALLYTVERERQYADRHSSKHAYLGSDDMVLITGHRRENFGGRFESICTAVAMLAEKFPQTQFVYPVHLNPNVREPVYRLLSKHENIHLVEPAAYPEFVWLMDRSKLILTDSGGVQEEAPSLRKPVLVMRDTTERPEAVEAGAVQLIGSSTERIVAAATQLLTDHAAYADRQLEVNPYGDGHSARRIIDHMLAAGWAREAAPRRAAA